MSVTLPGQLPATPARRVRHEVRDGIAVIAFSAVSSSVLAVALMMFNRLVG